MGGEGAPAVPGYKNNPRREGWGRGIQTKETRPSRAAASRSGTHLGPAAPSALATLRALGLSRWACPRARVRGARTASGPQAAPSPGSPAGKPCPARGAGGGGRERFAGPRSRRRETRDHCRFPRGHLHLSHTGLDPFTPQPSEGRS